MVRPKKTPKTIHLETARRCRGVSHQRSVPLPTAADCATLAAEAPVLGVGDRPTPAGVPAHELSSASGRKLQLQSRSIADSCQPGTDQEWCIANVKQLSQLVGGLLCPSCLSSGVTVNIMPKDNMGFASKLAISCAMCAYTNDTMSSPRALSKDKVIKGNAPFEINKRMVMLSHELGAGQALLQKFGVVMGIPPMHLKTFQGHDKTLSGKI